MGAVFVTANQLYAVHIPDTSEQSRQAGAAAFVNMITGVEGANPHGSLHVFVNGMNRPTADQEAAKMRDDLGGPVTRVYRMMEHLHEPHPQKPPRRSAWVKVVRNGPNVDMRYKYLEDTGPQKEWMAGGNAKTGIYEPSYETTFGGAIMPTPGALANQWFPIDLPNCHMRYIH
jgi:hypothetical protein